jgi:serine/threonine protein kinase/tetratricopeptide (TPR) repeat protein
LPAAEAKVARLTEEMVTAWQQGNCTRAEDYLALHPDLWSHPEAAVDLIYEEICLRREYGQEITRAEILGRFPQWQAQLEILLDCQQILEVGSAPVYPRVGESVGDFHLRAKLGHGGHGCVFLATQTSLADRPVVIKFTPLLGHEHLSLARLQHTHIMPLFSVLEDSERNLRAMCMPYFGGATLAQLLTAIVSQPLNSRTGQDLLRALDEAQAAAGIDLPSRDPARQFLARASYVQALCWIGACLAEALKYAHDRGLVHLDVKPSNVLLTADAQPMLLDFHLANKLIEPGGPQPIWMGGTPTYMSPEQRVALAESRDQRPISVVVDGRSDLYSLGLLLYEALGGSAPHTPITKTTRSLPRALERESEGALSEESAAHTDLPCLSRCNPQVGTGLADVLAKCLAHDPKDRYADAGALAGDLWRHLKDMPLRGVRNRSLAERWQKWRRRRPHALSFCLLVLLVLFGGLASAVMVLTYAKHQIAQAEAALEEGRKQLLKYGKDELAISILTRGLSQVENIPGSRDLELKLTEELDHARRAQAARELHRLADRFRLFYGVDFLSRTDIRELERSCREFWNKRHWIMNRLAPDSELSSGADLEQHVKADLLDLAILHTSLLVRRASGSRFTRQKKRATLAVLDQAQELFGESAVLYYERQRQAVALGLPDIANEAATRRTQFTPSTAWEYFALGRALLDGPRLDEAASMLEKAVELDPRRLWPRFYQGICAYRLHKYEDAVLAFTMCVVLTTQPPEMAGCLYNRALAYQGSQRSKRAMDDYDDALRLDPNLGVAALNRGILHCQEKRYPLAYADFQRALEDHVDPATVHYNLALLYLAQEQPDDARASVKRALDYEPDHKEARALSERLQRQ